MFIPTPKTFASRHALYLSSPKVVIRMTIAGHFPCVEKVVVNRSTHLLLEPVLSGRHLIALLETQLLFFT